MFCPQCRAEYREGITSCPECEVELVAEPPPEEEPDLAPVFESAEVDLVPVVKSLLDSAGIPYMVQGDEALGLFPVGGAGAALSRKGRGLAATFHVPRARAAEAEELLANLRSEGGDQGSGESG